MKEFIKWFKENFNLVLIVFVSFFSIFMYIAYRATFRGVFSDDPNDWGNFGAYFGSITGLLAFAGVLYSIKQSSNQAKINEERGIFFKMWTYTRIRL